MSGIVTEERILQAINKGMIEACDRHHRMTGGAWLWAAPEYLSTVHIAEEISALDEGHLVELEVDVKALTHQAGPRLRGRKPAAVREGGRVDIALYWKNGSPRAIIEVKRFATWMTPLNRDLDRLMRLYQNAHETSLSFAVLTATVEVEGKTTDAARKKVELSREKIRKAVEAYTEGRFAARLCDSDIRDEGVYAWSPVVILLKPQP